MYLAVVYSVKGEALVVVVILIGGVGGVAAVCCAVNGLNDAVHVRTDGA